MLLISALAGFAIAAPDVGRLSGTPQPGIDGLDGSESAAFAPVLSARNSEEGHSDEGGLGARCGRHNALFGRSFIEQRYRMMPSPVALPTKNARTGGSAHGGGLFYDSPGRPHNGRGASNPTSIPVAFPFAIA